MVEEPRRTPWRVIAVLVLVGTVIAWAVTNLDVDFKLPSLPRPEPLIQVREAPPQPVDHDASVYNAEGVVMPRWAHQVAADYPPAAYDVSEARVQITCLVRSDFRLDDCEVLDEEPTGYGFGENALEAARASSVTRDSPVGARITYTVRYALQDG